jgi:CheY-like chemotaxis protein
MSVDPVLLVVEDDESDVIFLQRALRKASADFTIRVAEDGRRAIDYLSGQGAYADRAANPTPTHVLLDLKLPEKSGFEVLQWLRADPDLKLLRVSILTSSSEARDLQRARALGADCYLVKPMSFALLLDLAIGIRDWVQSGRIPDASQWPPESLVAP